MIPALRGQGFGFTIRVNNFYLFLSDYFSDGIKRVFKFLFKIIRNLVCILSRDRAQQGVLLPNGKGEIDGVKIKTGAEIFQVWRNGNFSRI